MAFFPRGDEANSKILCKVCGVNVNENSFTKHVTKCSSSQQHSAKFDKNLLERCRYNSTHIVKGGQMETHLEFCDKYQNTCRLELQEILKRVQDEVLAAKNEAE